MEKPNLKVKNVESRVLTSSDPGLGFNHNSEVYKCMHIHRHHLKSCIKTFNYLPLCPISSHRFYAVVLIPTIPHQQAATKLNRKQKIIVLKKLRHYFANKGPSSQGYGFSSGHVWMWELDCEESWAPKNWCFWTVVLEKTLESPLDCKKIQPVHSEGDQPWVFFGRNDAEAETPVLWPPHAKSWLVGKDSDAGRDWGQEEKGMTEDGMAGWHHRLDGREFEWTAGVGDGQGGLACCNSWGRKESDMTKRLTELNWSVFLIVLMKLLNLLAMDFM